MIRRFLLLALLCLPSVLAAHPHMFIDTRLKIDIQGNSLKQIEITWYFDPMFTASIVGDFDGDRNGVFTPEETEGVREYAFSNLENYDYFTFLELNGTTHVPRRIENFRVFVENRQLVYRFSIPFDLEVKEKKFAIAIYDESYFCDILFHEESPIEFQGTRPADWEILENKDMSINYGGPVSVSRDGKEYSGTAFPQQLQVSLR
ncbi:DUF1007 family protein [Marispirochaeta aestuarii]|uniref:DUF1007 family protein n=1 Tax=Marispirochaeta aestuarii TaxID=1963862 RepID=UPI002ABE7E48|nr:DUF1007 family protein [Marispirochaeta aestuarii]